MRLLVTGGNGFIGSNLALRLEEDGHEVVVIDHTERCAHLRSFHGEYRREDITQENLWEGLEPFDTVFHEAACTDTTVTDRKTMMAVNTEAFRRLFAWAQRTSSPVIYASSAAVYGASPSPQRVGFGESPLNVYGESKRNMDDFVRSLLPDPPVKIIGLRYFNVYGPGEDKKEHMASMIYRLAQEMKAGKHPRIFSPGDQARDQIYVGDVVEANICALRADRKQSGIYNVGTGTAVTFNAIVQELNNVFKTSLEPDYFENPYPFYQDHTCADITLTREHLVFSPRFSLHEGIRQYFASGAL